MTLSALGLDEEKTKDYIRQNKPTYPEFEAWVKANGRIDQAAIEKHNAAVRGYNHDDETRQGIFRNNKLTDESCSYRDAVNLNNLDDWQEFHQAVLK
jgi:hypothetical protein